MTSTIITVGAGVRPKWNRDRLEYAESFDIDIIMKDGSVYPCHKNVLSKTFGYFEAEFDEATKSGSHKIHVPVADSEIMKAFLDMAYTGQLSISNESAYDILHCSVILEFKNLEGLCETIFSRSFLTSRLFDIFDLFHRTHFKSPMWYEVLKYTAKRFKELSLRDEYVAAPYDKIRPKCTTLFRYLPAFMERNDYLLDYIIRWGNYNYEERKNLIPRLLEKIYIRDVTGTFAKSLITKLFDVEDLVGEKAKGLRAFMKMEKQSQHFHFECQLQKSGAWHYVNCEVGEPVINSRFVTVDGILYNLRSVYEGGVGEKRGYVFRCTLVNNYENLLKSNAYGVRDLEAPSFKAKAKTFDMTVANAGIYVYLSTASETEYLYKQIYVYKRERDAWYQLSQFRGGYDKPLIKSCLISHENSIYLIGGQKSESRHDTNKRGYFFRIDQRDNRIRKLPSLKGVRANSAACVYNDKIYVAGGQDKDEKILNTAEVFDLKAGKWNTTGIASMKFKRQNFRLLAFEKKLWAIGNTFSVVEAYDPQTNIWSLYEQSLDQLVHPIITGMLQPQTSQKCSLRTLDAIVF